MRSAFFTLGFEAPPLVVFSSMDSTTLSDVLPGSGVLVFEEEGALGASWFMVATSGTETARGVRMGVLAAGAGGGGICSSSLLAAGPVTGSV
jgi:hypothetical protein